MQMPSCTRIKTFSQNGRRFKKRRGFDKTEAQLIRSEKLAALGQLAAGIAHEIRNPLTSINILIHSLASNLPSGTSQKEDLKVIEEEIHRINEIVDQFLRFAKPAPPLLGKAEVVSIVEGPQLLGPPSRNNRSLFQKNFSLCYLRWTVNR
jgi:signal transduction histidine kinase